MPTVSVGRDRLFAALGRTYTQEEFEALCFEFGIELDDVVTSLSATVLTTEKAIIRKEKHLEDDGEVEGDDEVIYKIEVAANRYDLLCLEGLARALRVFTGTEASPVFRLSSIPRGSMLQMHVKPQALPPHEINFVPLKQEENFRADKLMEFYKSDMKLKKFLHIIENSPVYPVIYDSNRTVLSLPPIINGAHSAITLATRNVFIECTATDLTKAKIVLNTMVTMFSEYCENKFEVEPVEVVHHDGSKTVYPDLSCYKMEASLSDILGPIGISLDEKQVVCLLNKMQLQAESHSSKGDPRISVSVPPTRSDILQARDLVEVDVAIAYGYNNVPKSKPKCMTIGGRQPLNRFSDKIRAEVARAGYMEVVRTSLMSCLLKTLKHNIDHPRPIKIFEVGDVVTLDPSRDVGASNNRRLAALYCNRVSGFEEIMGLVDSIVKVVRAPHVNFGEKYYVPTNEPEFFPKRQCKIVTSDGKQVGYLGIVHAEVLRKFGIPDPCTFVEMDIEALL
ncbi:Phenylalanine--tRNA ligase beta subunit, cytoplasmic [Dichanthelium oligosanthes]|uniref:phenylalanine--tRNA ligase n=1 Tax=Dichanthelium oligosanthes TaxID=888268 RepID=A0A1E5UMG8_9POAL|nr:Phenylalanine--tRNA ligase beta subunit, cytoplasmic [Dichanthelium oligosanthes]